MVGIAANRVSSVARYCCSDCPAASARRCRLACTSSGRSRTNTFGMLAFCYHIVRKATHGSNDRSAARRSALVRSRANGVLDNERSACQRSTLRVSTKEVDRVVACRHKWDCDRYVAAAVTSRRSVPTTMSWKPRQDHHHERHSVTAGRTTRTVLLIHGSRALLLRGGGPLAR